MEYNNEKQEFDFIERTHKTLKQYQELNIDEKDKYEVTLFLNCFVGLLIVPQQKWFNDLPTILITKDEWGIAPNELNFGNINKRKNIRNIAIHLRNSVSHYNFHFQSTNQRISSIRFEDFQDHNKIIKTFDATINVEDLQKFIDKFISTMLALKTS